MALVEHCHGLVVLLGLSRSGFLILDDSILQGQGLAVSEDDPEMRRFAPSPGLGDLALGPVPHSPPLRTAVYRQDYSR